MVSRLAQGSVHIRRVAVSFVSARAMALSSASWTVLWAPREQPYLSGGLPLASVLLTLDAAIPLYPVPSVKASLKPCVQ